MSDLPKFRFVILAMCVTATLVQYATRTNINNALVSMVKSGNKSGIVYEECPSSDVTESQSDPNKLKARQFDWDPTTQGLLLSSFYYGVIFLQIPAGRLSELFGGKWIVAFGIIISGIINILTPQWADFLGIFLSSRVILGLAQGGVFPACFCLVCVWLAPKERSLGFGLVHVGSNLGTMLAATSTGFISHDYGWPAAFVTLGTMAIIWVFLWILVVREPTFAEKRNIMDEEDEDDEDTDDPLYSSEEGGSNSRPPVPWIKILTNPAVLAAICARFGASFAYLTLQTKLPGYLKFILHVPDSTNGLLNSMLYGAACVAQVSAPTLSEVIISREWLSRTNTRKLFSGVGMYGCVLCFALVPFTGCSKTGAMFLLILGIFLYGITTGGDLITPAEMSNKFPATIYALVNMVAQLAGMIAPILIGVILSKATTGLELKTQWNYVFYMVAAIITVFTTVFMIFGSAEIQPFDQSREEKKYNAEIARRRSRRFSVAL